MNENDTLHPHWLLLNYDEDLVNRAEYLLSGLEYKINFMDVPLNKKFYEKNTQFNRI